MKTLYVSLTFAMISAAACKNPTPRTSGIKNSESFVMSMEVKSGSLYYNPGTSTAKVSNIVAAIDPAETGELAFGDQSDEVDLYTIKYSLTADVQNSAGKTTKYSADSIELVSQDVSLVGSGNTSTDGTNPPVTPTTPSKPDSTSSTPTAKTITCSCNAIDEWVEDAKITYNNKFTLDAAYTCDSLNGTNTKKVVVNGKTSELRLSKCVLAK